MSYFGNSYYFKEDNSKFPLKVEKLHHCKILCAYSDFLSIQEKDSTHLLEILKTLPEIVILEFLLKTCNEDIEQEIVLRYLKELRISTNIPMNYTKIWKLFRNLEEINIFNIESFTFIRRLLSYSRKTLKKLTLTDISLREFRESFKIPCQLEYLKIKLRDFNIDRNLETILKSQRNLKVLKLENCIINDYILEAISLSGTKDLHLEKVVIENLKLSDSSISFLNSLEKLEIKNVQNGCKLNVEAVLTHLKNIESLKLSSLGKDFKISSKSVLKNKLENINNIHIEGSKLSYNILDIFEFGEHLETLHCEINSLDILTKLSKTCPNLKNLKLDFSNKDVFYFVLREFKYLETLQITMGFMDQNAYKTMCKMLFKKAITLKRVNIFLDNYNSRAKLIWLMLPEDFKMVLYGTSEIVHNCNLNFKLLISHVIQKKWLRWYIINKSTFQIMDHVDPAEVYRLDKIYEDF